ncbi:hypothetical protein [Phaffia rhodozyma]|uniref:Uncharacterized protein n=1 Tax=Phaffia rhodozyma TaxID=264483 RepID=A0A0F7SXQ5_PHARH|nr:hypothetical protein [Phaffia rhodozyma]
MAPPLSRVQLAAALIEYDNDNPYTTELKHASQSAIIRGNAPQEPPKDLTAEYKRKSMAWEQDQLEREWKENEEREYRIREYQAEEERRKIENEQRQSQTSPTPSTPMDFRRSASPFMAEALAREGSPSTPSRSRTTSYAPSNPLQQPSSTATTPRKEPITQIVQQPKPTRPKSTLLGSWGRNIETDIVSTEDQHQQSTNENLVEIVSPPSVMVPSRPHSSQALSHIAPVHSPTFLDQSNRQGSESALSMTSIPLNYLASDRPGSVPLPERYTSPFNVPVFDESIINTKSKTKAKRRRSSFLFGVSGEKEALPPSSQAPMSPTQAALMRESISMLPRSLGGDPPSMNRRMGAHPKSRTGSMGDWEAFVFNEGHSLNQNEMGVLRLDNNQSTTRAETRESTRTPSVSSPQLPPVSSLNPDAVFIGEPAENKESDSLEFLTPSTSDEIDFNRSRQPTSQTIPTLSSRTSYDSSLSKFQERGMSPNWEQVSLSGITSPLEKISRRPLSGGSNSELNMLARTSQTQPVPVQTDLSTLDSERMSLTGDHIHNRERSSRASLDSRVRLSSYHSDNKEELLDVSPTEQEGQDRENEERAPSRMSLMDEIGLMTPDLLSSSHVGDEAEIAQARQRARTRSSNLKGKSGAETEAARLEEDEYDADENERERESWLPPPTSGRASRFDPKSQLIKSSADSVLQNSSENNHPPEEIDTRQQRRPGKPKTRPSSLAHFSNTRRLATTATSSIHLPAMLIMPAPLDPNSAARVSVDSRPGFVQVEEKPFPADFTRPRQLGRATSFVSSAAALAIPNNRLSLAQKTFRASLVVDGKRPASFLGGALEEGEKASLRPEDTDETEEDILAKQWMARQEDDYRAPGQLYGRSLIEVLEERKAALKSKQRVFRGDSRPAMFTRSQTSNTLVSIRPETVHLNPTFPSYRTGLDDAADTDPQGALHPPSRPGGLERKTRSVFGVDALWEKESREREIADRIEREETSIREEEERLKNQLKEQKRKKRFGGKRSDSLPMLDVNNPSFESELSAATQEVDLVQEKAIVTPLPESPTKAESVRLPVVRSRPIAQLPMDNFVGDFATSDDIQGILQGDSDLDDGNEEATQGTTPQARSRVQTGSTQRNRMRSADWHLSSDEDEPGRSSRVRKPVASSVRSIPASDNDDSSDEEVPLSQLVAKGIQPKPYSKSIQSSQLVQNREEDDSSDEEPLARLKEKKELTSDLSHPKRGSASLPAPRDDGDDDDDDAPLALRLVQPGYGGAGGGRTGEEDDDLPLGVTQAQHLQQQYYQQQAQLQQQQQMMMARQSMMSLNLMGMGMPMGGPGMMGMQGFPGGGHQQQQGQMPGMMGGNMPSQLKVDRWRRGVAVDEA